MSRVCAVLFVTVGLSVTCLSQAGDRWPEWRGATGQGHSDATDLPVSWSETKNVAWKVKIPGRGWSTPVIDSGQVWGTTAIDKLASKADAARRRNTSSGIRKNCDPVSLIDSHRFST